MSKINTGSLEIYRYLSIYIEFPIKQENPRRWATMYKDELSNIINVKFHNQHRFLAKIPQWTDTIGKVISLKDNPITPIYGFDLPPLLQYPKQKTFKLAIANQKKSLLL